MGLKRTEEFDVVYVGEETEVNTVPLTADQQNPLYNSLVGKVEITHYAFETRDGKEKFSFPAFDVPKKPTGGETFLLQRTFIPAGKWKLMISKKLKIKA